MGRYRMMVCIGNPAREPRARGSRWSIANLIQPSIRQPNTEPKNNIVAVNVGSRSSSGRNTCIASVFGMARLLPIDSISFVPKPANFSGIISMMAIAYSLEVCSKKPGNIGGHSTSPASGTIILPSGVECWQKYGLDNVRPTRQPVENWNTSMTVNRLSGQG